MTELNYQELGRKLLTAVFGALSALKLYPIENETVQQALTELHTLVEGILKVDGSAEIRVVGDFCAWDGRLLPMARRGDSGVWELFVPMARAGELYKFEIKSAHGAILLKADPLAREESADSCSTFDRLSVNDGLIAR